MHSHMQMEVERERERRTAIGVRNYASKRSKPTNPAVMIVEEPINSRLFPLDSFSPTSLEYTLYGLVGVGLCFSYNDFLRIYCTKCSCHALRV